MRWPFKHRAHVPDEVGKEKAKLALSIAKTLEATNTRQAAQLHQRMLANHLGPTIQRATGPWEDDPC